MMGDTGTVMSDRANLPSKSEKRGDRRMFQLTERRRVSDQVANHIREYIIHHQLKPGDRLPTELEMAEQFGCSRVSIREATKALGFLGFLEATPRRGTTVGQIDLHRVTQFLELHPSLSGATARQLVEARHVLDLGMLPYLLDRMRKDPAIYDQLNSFLKTFNSAVGLRQWLELDRQFHSRLMDASGLTPLFLFHEMLAVFFARIQQLARNPKIRERLLAQVEAKQADHQRIIDYLRSGDLDAAQQELKQHISGYEQILDVAAA
jgi:DNA-binding FadR family transcriptional regulator